MIRPKAGWVVVKPEAVVEKSKGGIIIADTAKEKPTSGVVVASGGGKWFDNGTRKPAEVKVGEKVLYSQFMGTEITTQEGEQFLVMKEDEILCVEK